jgi:hypothetical protein
MTMKLKNDALRIAEPSDEDLKAVNENLKAQIRDFERERRGFIVILKERDALADENAKLKVELDWYRKRFPGPGLSG